MRHTPRLPSWSFTIQVQYREKESKKERKKKERKKELQKIDKARIRTNTHKNPTNVFIGAKHNELKTNLKQNQNEFITYE